MSKLWRASILGFALVLGSFSALFAQSQATTGVIEGTVMDEEGGVLPGASVAIRNTATNFEQVVTTGANGRFRGAAAAPRPLPGHGDPRRLRHPGPRGDRSGGRSDDQPGPDAQVSGLEQRSRSPPRRRSSRPRRTEGSIRIDDAGRRGPPEQRPQLPRLHEAHARRDDRAGPRRRRADRSTARRASTTTSRWTAPTSTTPSSASSAAASAPPSRSTSTRCRRSSWSPTARRAEFGRSSGGFVNVVTKSGTNDIHGSAHVFFKNDSLSARRRTPTAPSADEVRLRPAAGRLHARRAAHEGQALLLRRRRRTSAAARRSRPTRTASSRVSSTSSPASACPNENGPIDADQRRARLPRQDRLAGLRQQHLATLRYNYT